MEDLLTLPGVARKTVNVVLGTAYGIASGIALDTHVFRVATRRLKLLGGKTPEKVEQDLVKIVPCNRWIRFSYQHPSRPFRNTHHHAPESTIESWKNSRRSRRGTQNRERKVEQDLLKIVPRSRWI